MQSTIRKWNDNNKKNLVKFNKKPKPLLFNRTKKEVEFMKTVPNTQVGVTLRTFVVDWYVGIIKAIEAVLENQNKKINSPPPGTNPKDMKPVKGLAPAKLVSRSDLSRTRPPEELENMYKDKELCYNNKGFYGTPLPLIPDIRSSEVSEGHVGVLLDAFGVSKRFGRTVTLFQGPNRRLNRYLTFQYKRLIKSIDGTIVKGSIDEAAHVIWSYDFYRISQPNSGVNAKTRKLLRQKVRTYWGIAMQLLRHSIAFRVALVKKSMGRNKRWFHRNFDFTDLFSILKGYQEIAAKFDPGVEVKRVWICTEQRDKSFKWRPLGTSPWAWRIFTRGINNLLETFISGSWPENQHGYKSGRGVHTVWNQVLNSVISAKYIFEFDFSGFFNTVRIEAVGDVLHRLYVPKFMCAYLVTIASVDVKNISIWQLLRNLKTKDPRKQGFEKAWAKYEYIHKYREGYRSCGLPQGFALSPLLSVITLTVLDELEEIGIKYVIYCDDGIFYSDKEVDFVKEAQKVLDKHGIGAYFNMYKSASIRENGKWLSNLKLVGLEYNPFSNELSAATRNGATLKLKIGAIGLFSKKNPKLDYPIKSWAEGDHLDWKISNEKLLQYYEKIYLLSGYQTTFREELYEKLSKIAAKLIIKRFEKYSWYNLIELLISTEGELMMEDYIYPLAILKETSRELCNEAIDKYKSSTGEEFPFDVLQHVSETILWMNKKMSSKEYESLIKCKLQEMKEEFPNDIYIQRVDIDSEAAKKGTKFVLEQLYWFEQLDSPPESLKALLDEKGNIELGEWFNIEINKIDKSKLPKVCADHLMKHGGRLGYTEVTWQNLFKDPVFATFIARLFQDSFRSGVVKQSFRLTTDKECVTLVKLIDKYIGRDRWTELYSGGRFDIFNSSSFCANLLTKLLKTWSKHIKVKNLPPIETAYKTVIHKIINRRSRVDWILRDTSCDNDKKPRKREDMNLIMDHKLQPYKTHVTAEHRNSMKHLKMKYENVKTLDIKTISRSAISTQELYTKLFKSARNEMIYPLKAVRWDTLAPKHIEKRGPAIAGVSMTIQDKLSHPLLSPKLYSQNDTFHFPKTNQKWVKLSEDIRNKTIQKTRRLIGNSMETNEKNTNR